MTIFSIIVPTFNESGNIDPLLGRIHDALAKIPHEIIIVDDDSPDKTWELVEKISQTSPWVRVIRRLNKKGLSSAVIDGFEAAKGSILGVMDADMSHDAAILPHLISALSGRVELAVGSRYIPGGGSVNWPWYRRLSSWTATKMAKTFLNVPLSDPMSGYFVLTKELFQRCRTQLEPMGFKILLEIFCKGRPSEYRDVAYVFQDRKLGTSKLSGLVIKDYLKMLLKLRSSGFNQQGR